MSFVLSVPKLNITYMVDNVSDINNKNNNVSWWSSWCQQDGYFPHFIIVMLFIYFLTISLSFWWGVAFLVNGNGFLQKPNWSLAPVFFIILTYLVRYSWHPFIEAWKDFPKSEVIKYKNSNNFLKQQIIDELIQDLNRWRKYIVFVSLIVGGILTYIDITCLVEQYSSNVNLCTDQKSSCYKECDFSIAYIVYPGTISYTENLVFNIFAYTLQCGEGFCGLFTLMQLLIHTIGFIQFESFRSAKKHNLILKLNIRDRLKEFGLSRWNWAINYGYGIMAFGMIPAVISAYVNRGKPTDPGQLILHVLIPIILLIPIGFAVFGRFVRLPPIQNEARQDDNLSKLLAENKLWPFDRHKIGKIFIGIAIFEYSYVLGAIDWLGTIELIKSFLLKIFGL